MTGFQLNVPHILLLCDLNMFFLYFPDASTALGALSQSLKQQDYVEQPSGLSETIHFPRTIYY